MPEAAAPALYRREGGFLVVRDGAVLPARCVRTNQPVEGGSEMQVETMRFTRGWILFLAVMLINVGHAWFPKIPTLPFIEAWYAMGVAADYVFSWKAKLSYGLESTKRRTARRNINWIWLARVVGLVCFGIGMEEMGGDWWWLIFPGIPLLMGAIGITRVYPQPLIAVRHRDGEFWLKGASPAFLDSLASSSPDP